MDSNRDLKNNPINKNDPVTQSTHGFDPKDVLNLLESWEPDQLFRQLISAQASFSPKFPNLMQSLVDDLSASSTLEQSHLTPNAQITSSVSIENNNNVVAKPSVAKGRSKRRPSRDSKRRCLNKPPKLKIDDDTLVSKQDGKELTQQELDSLRPGPKNHQIFKRHKIMMINNKATEVDVDEEAVTYLQWLNQYIWVLPKPSNNYELVYVDPLQYENIKSTGSSAPGKSGQKYYYGTPPTWVVPVGTYLHNYDKYNLSNEIDKATRKEMAKQLGLLDTEPSSKKSKKKTKPSLTQCQDTLFSKSRKKKSSGAKKQSGPEAPIQIQTVEDSLEPIRQPEAPNPSPPIVLEPWTPILPLTPRYGLSSAEQIPDLDIQAIIEEDIEQTDPARPGLGCKPD